MREKMKRNYYLFTVFICVLVFITNTFADNNADQNQFVTTIVNHNIQPLLEKYQIPGMAIAISINGKEYFYNYGVASKQTQSPVTQNTIFGVGSITKTFTATLAGYLNQTRLFDINQNVASYLSPLKRTVFDNITTTNLLTHTAGLPLLGFNNVETPTQLIKYLKHWSPEIVVGTQRMYSNVGYQLAGFTIESATDEKYETLIQENILNPLGLRHTYFTVPNNELINLAQGYDEHGAPQSLSVQPQLPAAFGMLSSSADLIKFVQANMQEYQSNSPQLNQALRVTQVAYYKTPFMTQDLAWEEYSYPLSLQDLLQGHNSELQAPAKKLIPSSTPNENVYIDKTGTGINNTFAAYVAFIPQHKIGIVILSNKFYPFNERPKVAYNILTQILKVQG